MWELRSIGAYSPYIVAFQWEQCIASARNRRGVLVVTLWPITLATRVRFPVGAVSRKSVRLSEVIFHLPPAISQAWYGGIQKGLVETGELSVFALFPVTRHNKELVEAQPWTSRSITHPPAFTAHMHTQVEGGHNREICTPPLKNSRGYEAFSLKRRLILEYGCWSMSPSNK